MLEQNSRVTLELIDKSVHLPLEKERT